MINEKYNTIFVPLEEVYTHGGRSVFDGFSRKKNDEKNLIVLFSEIAEKLDPEKRKDSFKSEGGLDALNFLKESKSRIIEKGDNKIRYSFEGADILYLTSSEKSDSLDKKLLKKIKKEYNTDLKIITINPKEYIKYSSMGFEVGEPTFLMASSDNVNEGVILGNEKLLSELYTKNKVKLDVASDILERELFPNQFIKFIGKNKFVYSKVIGDVIKNSDNTRIIKIENEYVGLLSNNDYEKKYNLGNLFFNNIFGVFPKDMEQYLAVQYGVLNPNIEIAVICGAQGSGKTLLGYTSAVKMILNYGGEISKKMGISPEKESFFKKIVLLKPNDMMGGKKRFEGYLPGSLWEKINQHLNPFIDSHKESNLDEISFNEMILHPRRDNEYGSKRKIDKVCGGYLPSKNEAIELTLSGYMRGRSFTDTLVLVDEAENFTQYEMKTIISRLGIGSKCIIMGDPEQTDNPDCSININGLTGVIKHYLKNPKMSLMCLSKNYRLESAEQAISWRVFGN